MFIFVLSFLCKKTPSPCRQPRDGNSQPFYFWLCADLYSAPTRRLRNLMSEVLFQFESEHSDRRIMYFDIDPPLGTDPPVYRRSYLFGRCRRAFIFFNTNSVSHCLSARDTISRVFVLRRRDCAALTKG